MSTKINQEEYFSTWSSEELIKLIKDQQTIVQNAHKALMFSVMANAVSAFEISADASCMEAESLLNLMATLKDMASDCDITHPSFQELSEWMDGEILRTHGLPDELNARLDEDEPGSIH